MNVSQGHGNAPGIRNSTDQTGNVTESINLAADTKSPDSPSLRSKTSCTDLSDGAWARDPHRHAKLVYMGAQ